jgi:hypothetical protein
LPSALETFKTRIYMVAPWKSSPMFNGVEIVLTPEKFHASLEAVNPRMHAVSEGVRRAELIAESEAVVVRAHRLPGGELAIIREHTASEARVLEEGLEQPVETAGENVRNAMQILDNVRDGFKHPTTTTVWDIIEDLTALRVRLAKALAQIESPEQRARAEWRVTQFHEPVAAP